MEHLIIRSRGNTFLWVKVQVLPMLSKVYKTWKEMGWGYYQISID